MDQLEVTRLGHPLLAGVRFVDLQLKLDVALADLALLLVRAGTVPRREFRVGRHGRTGDVVRHQGGVGPDVAEGDHVAVADDAPSSGRRDLAGGLDDPVVVGVVEGVAGDLLAGRRDAAVIVLERVVLRVRVQESFGPLVLDREGVVIADLCGTSTRQPEISHRVRHGRLTLGQSGQRAILQSLLECRTHKVVAGARLGQDGKVHPEPEQVDHRGDQDEADGAGGEVAVELFLSGFAASVSALGEHKRL